MVKYTEKTRDYEMTYEADTVQELEELRNTLLNQKSNKEVIVPIDQLKEILRKSTYATGGILPYCTAYQPQSAFSIPTPPSCDSPVRRREQKT